MVICTSLAISIPLATWHTRRWLHGIKPSGVSFVRTSPTARHTPHTHDTHDTDTHYFSGDFLMAVVIYPLVGATVFVACMALSFFVSGLLLSLIFGQMFIGDWWVPLHSWVCAAGGLVATSLTQRTHPRSCRHITLRTVFQFILLTGLVLAIMIGRWPHALLRTFVSCRACVCRA